MTNPQQLRKLLEYTPAPAMPQAVTTAKVQVSLARPIVVEHTPAGGGPRVAA